MAIEQEDLASLGVRMANVFAAKAASARVIDGTGRTEITDISCDAAARGFFLMAAGIRNLEARLAIAEKRADEYSQAMTQGLAIISYLRTISFAELLAWWRDQRRQQKKGAATC